MPPNPQTTTKARCQSCGYTEEDAKFHMDHHLCKNSGNAPWEKHPYMDKVMPRLSTEKQFDAHNDGWLEGYHQALIDAAEKCEEIHRDNLSFGMNPEGAYYAKQIRDMKDVGL